MFVSLLTTKLFFPRSRDNLIPRPRLLERLSTGLRGTLTLLSAPAGYGKTTLLSEWRNGTECDPPAAWLSLDGEDGDPTLFLNYLTAALGSLQENLLGSTLLLLQSPQHPPLNAILTSLVNDLSTFPQDFVLALDDYHAITSPAIHDTVTFLLDHAPPQMHLAILTREDPPLPLSKLRARGQLTEIREADLRFSPEEAAAFLTDTMALTLSEGAIAGLVERTEGWIAGLQMAGLSLQQQSNGDEFVAAFRGQDRYVMDYLMDEVFHRQPVEIQGFLLDNSILDRLCGPLCDALAEVSQPHNTGTTCPPSRDPFKTSQEILEYLEHTNLFTIPLDNKRKWYRFHPLFADLLRYRLLRLHPERLPGLHRRACHWYAQAGNPDEAMKHALAVPDHDLAADLAEQFLLLMTGASRLGTYLTWLEKLPDKTVCDRAYLCAGCAWAYVLTHQLDAARRYVDCGESALAYFEPVYSSYDRRWITQQEVFGNLAAIRSFADRLQGDLPGAVGHARQALEALPPEARAIHCAVALNLGMLHLDTGELDMAQKALGEAFESASRPPENVYVAVSALCLLGSILVLRGKLRESESVFRRAIRFGTQGRTVAAPIPSAGVAHGWLAAVHYQRNELAEAQLHLDAVMQSVEQMGVPETTIRAYLHQALLAQSRGEVDVAEDWFGKAEQLIGVRPVQEIIRTEWIAFRGRFYLALGDYASIHGLLAAQRVQATDLDTPSPHAGEQMQPPGPRLARYLLLAHAMLAQGELGQVAKLLERVCSLAEEAPDFALCLEALVLQAVTAYKGRGDMARALPCLERALKLAAPERYVRPFLNAGEPVTKLLRHAIALNIQPAFAHTLLAELTAQERLQIDVARRLTGRAPMGPRHAGGCSTARAEPLTEREQQVLRLLAAGLSSTEVAEELVIAVSTARSYIKSVYGKVDAHCREEAIDRARELGLI
jgi:ATP/maltotriose-dependent transcriptional regulator MalT